MESIAIDRQVVTELRELLVGAQTQLRKVQQRLDDENQPMTLAEAAKYLKVSPKQFYIYRDRREIEFVQYGDKVWVMRSELDDFLKRHTIKRRKS